MGYIIHNGKTMASGKPLFTADNRSFRYGDGCFETMRIYNSKILLKELHFERLFSSLKILKFVAPAQFTAGHLEDAIMEMAKKNGASLLGRIRLTIYRSDGGLQEPVNHYPNYVIQAWPMAKEAIQLNDHGLQVDFFHEARKCCDELANIKSNNYLPYVLAAIHAREKKLNDCILLNAHDKVVDSSIANVFIIKNDQIFTPPLTDGCVAGVTRRFLLQLLHLNGIKSSEKSISTQELLHADEVFLTNSIAGVKWVAACGPKKYRHQVVKQIHSLLHLSLFF